MSEITRDADWYDEFWSHAPEHDEDRGLSAIRILAELFDGDLIWRDGDHLKGRANQTVALNPEDQFLVRQIEDAAKAARRATDEEEESP